MIKRKEKGKKTNYKKEITEIKKNQTNVLDKSQRSDQKTHIDIQQPKKQGKDNNSINTWIYIESNDKNIRKKKIQTSNRKKLQRNN